MDELDHFMYFLNGMKKATYIPRPDCFNRVASRMTDGHHMVCIYHNYARNLPRGEFRVRNGIFVVNYVLHGKGYYRDETGAKHPLSAGSVLIFQDAPGRKISISPEEEFVECSCSCDAATFALIQQAGIIEKTGPVLNIGLREDALNAYFALFSELSTGSKQNAALPVRKLAAYMDTVYRPAAAPRDGFVEEAYRLLAENLSEKLQIESVAKKLRVPYHEFRKTFKAATGTAPGTYRIQRKLDHACYELLNGKSVQQTAAELGYVDPFHFSRQFKQHIGLSPLRFRQMYDRNPHPPAS
jgi:AraC-like DNA-binding protein